MLERLSTRKEGRVGRRGEYGTAFAIPRLATQDEVDEDINVGEAPIEVGRYCDLLGTRRNDFSRGITLVSM